jgi:hypothetical protein
MDVGFHIWYEFIWGEFQYGWENPFKNTFIHEQGKKTKTPNPNNNNNNNNLINWLIN